MPPVHRQGDLRQCGATTIVVGQSTVTVNDRLWAVDNDPNTHGAGNLIAATSGGSGAPITIEDKLIIVHAPDPAQPDNLFHPGPPTDTGQGSGDVSAHD